MRVTNRAREAYRQAGIEEAEAQYPGATVTAFFYGRELILQVWEDGAPASTDYRYTPPDDMEIPE